MTSEGLKISGLIGQNQAKLKTFAHEPWPSQKFTDRIRLHDQSQHMYS